MTDFMCTDYKPCNISLDFLDNGSMSMYEKLCYILNLLQQAIDSTEGFDGRITDNEGNIVLNAEQIALNLESILTLISDKADKTNVLELNNIVEFIPLNAYNPATKGYIDDAILGAILGDLPENSITNNHLAPTNKTGLLADLTTTDKSNLVNAINELLINIGANALDIENINTANEDILKFENQLYKIYKAGGTENDIIVNTDNNSFPLENSRWLQFLTNYTSIIHTIKIDENDVKIAKDKDNNYLEVEKNVIVIARYDSIKDEFLVSVGGGKGEVNPVVSGSDFLIATHLDTSDRINNYLVSNTSDINYIRTDGKKLQFVTAETDGLTTEQYSNVDGELVFWIDETHKATTLNFTNYPIIIYVYIEKIKMSFYFEMDIETGYMNPIMVLGIGDGITEWSGKATIEKSASGLNLTYFKEQTAEPIILQLNNDGIVQDGAIGEKALRNITVSTSMPENPQNNDLWIDENEV